MDGGSEMRIFIGILLFPILFGFIFNILFWAIHFLFGSIFIITIAPFVGFTFDFSVLLDWAGQEFSFVKLWIFVNATLTGLLTFVLALEGTEKIVK